MSELDFNMRLAEFAVTHVSELISDKPGTSGSYNQDFNLARNLPAFKSTFAFQPREKNWFEEKAAAFAKSVQGRDLDEEERIRQKTEHDKAQWRDALDLKKQEIEGLRNEQKRKVYAEYPLLTEDQADAADDDDTFVTCYEEQSLFFAAAVEKSGIGNCGEQSTVAFKYLLLKGASNVAIVDWVGGNHTFVVVGMDPSTPVETQATLLTAPNWGDSAVLCDPWYHEWFPVTSNGPTWKNKMRRILHETLDAKNKGSSHQLDEKNAQDIQGKIFPSNTEKVQLGDYNKVMNYAWTFKRIAFMSGRDNYLVKLAQYVSGKRQKPKRFGFVKAPAQGQPPQPSTVGLRSLGDGAPVRAPLRDGRG